MATTRRSAETETRSGGPSSAGTPTGKSTRALAWARVTVGPIVGGGEGVGDGPGDRRRRADQHAADPQPLHDGRADRRGQPQPEEDQRDDHRDQAPAARPLASPGSAYATGAARPATGRAPARPGRRRAPRRPGSGRGPAARRRDDRPAQPSATSFRSIVNARCSRDFTVPRRDAERRGGLGLGQLEQVAAGHHLAQLDRQRADPGAAARRGAPTPRAAASGSSKARSASGQPGQLLPRRPPAAAAEQVPGLVPDDGQQPAPELPVGAEPGQRRVRLDERVLDDVVGVRARTPQHRHPFRHGGMTAHQMAEGGPDPRPAPRPPAARHW